MIKISRARKPGILNKKAEIWTKNLLAAKSNKERKKAEAKYRHPAIKENLVSMFHGKCAYCESKITHIDYPHIEHYRPKSIFRALTFEWTNLLLACGICNGPSQKSDSFPETNEGGPLVNPCDDDPAEHFEFLYDVNTKIASVYGTTRRGKTTEKLLGLNRYELRRYRSKYVRKLYVLSRFAEQD